MKIEDKNIEKYLEKFFEGETNREEEKALSEYFKNSESFPEGIKEYRDMFRWIDDGMPGYERIEKNSLVGKIKIWLLSLSAAALIGLIINSWMSQEVKSSTINPEIIYAGSYVSHNGKDNYDIKSILPEIKETILMVDEMERKIENINFEIVNIEIE